MPSFEMFLYAEEMSFHTPGVSSPEAISQRVAMSLLSDVESVHNNLVETSLQNSDIVPEALIYNAAALNSLRKAVMENDSSVIAALEAMALSQEGYGYGDDEQYRQDRYDFVVKLFTSSIAK